MACASVDELAERVQSVARELPQYKLSFALVCRTILHAIAQYPLGATRAVLLSELLERAVAVSEQQLVTAARSLAFSALCTFDVVAVVPLAHELRLVALRVADRSIDAVSDDEDENENDNDGDDNDAADDDDDDDALESIPQLLRFVPSRKLVPFLAYARSLLLTAIHFGVQDSRFILPTPAVVPVLDSPDVLCAAPFARQRLSLLQLLSENEAASQMVLISPAYFVKCDVVAVEQDALSMFVSDGTLEGAADSVPVLVRDRANPILSLLRVGDIVLLIDFAFQDGALVLLEDRSVLFRLRERREPLLSAASIYASGASVALFGSPVASGASTASGAAFGSPTATRTLPRNANGEYDLEHVQRVTNVHDLRRGHINVSLMALVDASARNNDPQWPLALRVRDSHSSATVYLSPKFARAAAVLLGGEMIYLQNVCARATLAGSHKSTRFVLDELTLNTELTVVSQLSNVLATPSVCKPRSLAWLLERARAGRRRRRPVEHAAIHARITALHGAGRGATCGTAAHSVCERALVFSAEHRSLCCPLCARPVQQSEITTIYTLQCELTGDEADGAEPTTMVCTLRNSAAYHLLGMTATQYELLDDIARAQIQSRVLMKPYAMFVALVRQRRNDEDDDDDDVDNDDSDLTFRIDGVTANRVDRQG